MERRKHPENTDTGAGRIAGYSAAEASHVFEEFLEERLSYEAFWQWLQGYPYTPEGAPGDDPDIEDEINRAILALRAFQAGARSWPEVHRELMDSRQRLTGLARF
ncbi:MAG: hypothetical protein HY332_06295 [Chloroflexi bacterium]|nr:hypothetical protein [Chloroflexota bacterium]